MEQMKMTNVCYTVILGRAAISWFQQNADSQDSQWVVLFPAILKSCYSILLLSLFYLSPS